MNTYYAGTLLVYAAVDIIACLALNLQFGVSGIVNFSFIVFQSIGAYTAAVLSMPPDTANGHYQVYVGGLQLPFPIPWIGGALAGGLLAGTAFELAKRGFAVFVSGFPTYTLIYGAFAALLIFLIWVYVSWLIVLVGATFTATLIEPSATPKKT